MSKYSKSIIALIIGISMIVYGYCFQSLSIMYYGWAIIIISIISYSWIRSGLDTKFEELKKHFEREFEKSIKEYKDPSSTNYPIPHNLVKGPVHHENIFEEKYLISKQEQNKLKQHINNNELSIVINELCSITQDKSIYNEIINYSARLKDLEHKIRIGILQNNEVNLELNKLRISLLAVIDTISMK